MTIHEVASNLGVKDATVKKWSKELESPNGNGQGNLLNADDANRPDSAPTPNGEQHVSPTADESSKNLGSPTEPPGGCSEEPVAVQREGGECPSSTGRSVDTGSETWLLATNHLNMVYMLSASMLMGPAGFGTKHYRDPAAVFPGWLPLFRNAIPEAALKDSISERKDLRPCIAEVDIKNLSGQIRSVTRDGGIREASLPATLDGDVAALLVPAPLPASLLTALHFSSEDDRKQFDVSARDVETVDLSRIRTEVSRQAFADALSMRWPPAAGDFPIDDRQPARGQAVGGVLAMLYHLANRSDLCCSAYRVVAGARAPGDMEAIAKDGILNHLPHWLDSKSLPEDVRQDPRQQNVRLYWEVVDELINARLKNSNQKPVDTVLAYLEKQLPEVENKLRPRMENLIKAMRDAAGFGNGTISDLLKKHPGSLSRPLLLLSLRERCEGLFELAGADLKDEELALAAILFGIREGGWRKLPKTLRAPDELADYAMHLMCAIEQNARDDRGLTSVSKPDRPRPLRELLPVDPWSTSLEEEAFGGFARRQGWNECIVTHIRLPEGDYRLISRNGINIQVRGFIEPPRIEVDRVSLLKRLCQWPPLPAEREEQLRDILTRERG
jgi:hypothetical protein